jgi:predicted small metal-binding protein
VVSVEYLVECDCGWSCRGSEEEIIAACTEHGRAVHGLELTREQVLDVVQPIPNEPEQSAGPTKA